VWMYKFLKGTPPKLIEHIIELDITIPPVHQAKYRLNPNYVTIMKQNIDKLLTKGFTQLVEKATWLSIIVVIPNKNGKLKIYVDFIKLNATTKKDPFPLPFIDEVLNMVVGCEACSFLDGYSRYYKISKVVEDKYKISFVTNWITFI